MTAERLTEPFPGGLGSMFKLMQCQHCSRARVVREGWHGGYLTCEWCGKMTPHEQVNLQRLRDSITWLIDQMGRIGVKVGVCEDDYLTEQGVTYLAGVYGSWEGVDEVPSFEVRLHRDLSPWGLDLALRKALGRSRGCELLARLELASRHEQLTVALPAFPPRERLGPAVDARLGRPRHLELHEHVVTRRRGGVAGYGGGPSFVPQATGGSVLFAGDTVAVSVAATVGVV